MPRPRVKDEERRRVSRACDNCKRRKEKCDGTAPCNLCRRRNCEPQCVYTDVPSRLLQAQRTRRSLDLQDDVAYSSDAEMAVESLLNLSGNTHNAPGHDLAEGRDHLIANESHAPVPKMARLLRDKLGKFMFVGDSSNLAFLQMIRRQAKDLIGDCPFTMDPARKTMVEATPGTKLQSPRASINLKPSAREAEELVRHFLLATSGVMDLFDPNDIMMHLTNWASEPSLETDFNCSIYYLVLAIGAQVQPDNAADEAAERYFDQGRRLVMGSLLDEPSTLTIQASCLICFYLLTACRRNAAFMLFGIAVRAAHALGLHRSDVSRLFEARERRTRERTWKSVRVLDLFMSGSLGRPPATSEVDGGNVSWNRASRDYDDIQLGVLNSSATLRLCFILERILNEVYCRREVSVQLVESISRQYRDWTLQLPEGLHHDGLGQDADNSPDAAMRRAMGVAHLKGAYYWSIIILTRPFLLFRVSSERVHASVETFADACVDSALRSMEIATDVIHLPGIPRRLPWVINSLFVSALVFGLACFGDLDKSFPLLSSLDQSKVNLTHFATSDPSARRYLNIIEYLQQAVLTHVKTRDLKQMARRQKDVSKMFGDMPENGSSMTAGENIMDPAPGSPTTGRANEPPSGTSQSGQSNAIGFVTSSAGPVLTTSGFLAHQQSVIGIDDNRSTTAVESNFATNFSEKTTFPTDSSFAEEFPLWSLLNDYDPLLDTDPAMRSLG